MSKGHVERFPSQKLSRPARMYIENREHKSRYFLDEQVECAYWALKETPNALAIAANQCKRISDPYRFFVVNEKIMNEHGLPATIINPQIVKRADQRVIEPEGCLSFPGLTLNVSRPDEIHVAFETYHGELKEMNLFGLGARVFEHEVEHLDGENFTKNIPNRIERFQVLGKFRKNR